MQLSHNEERLVVLAVSGDSIALKTLLLLVDPVLRGWLLRRIPPFLTRVLDPEDIIQETYVDVFRRIGSFEHRGSGSFPRWVAAIAGNRLRNGLRRMRANKRGGGRESPSRPANIDDSTVALFDLLAGPDKTPSRVLARVEVLQAMKDGLATLPDRYRDALQCVYLEGWTAAEAASRLGCTERAVHGLCRRGLRLLESRMQVAIGSVSSLG